MILPDAQIVVVGAGCFGVSTAYHLLKRGYTNLTILDRSQTLPAPDAASNDLNRVVRSSYADPFYTRLARDAITAWKDTIEWGGTYHESGVLVLGLSDHADKPPRGSYADESYQNDVTMGAKVSQLANAGAAFPPHVRVGHALGGGAQDGESVRTGYLNHDGGWANASAGLSILINKVIALNGKFLTGKDVKALIRQNGKTNGVQCGDGSVVLADLVIIATGSWTAAAFPTLGLRHMCLATGQCIAMVQLSEEEAKLYKNCPVFLDFATGFYVFPPNEDNIVKFAIHSAGYTHTIEDISTPRTITSDPTDGLRIPSFAAQELRRLLRDVYPDLAEKPFVETRMCWYNDSPDGDWVIGWHPKDHGLLFATAGSGHAYKFLPVLGRLVADLVEGELSPDLVSKFALNRIPIHLDTSRSGKATELGLERLCTAADLLP